MSWRIASHEQFYRYAVRCGECGLRRGWPTEAAVKQHLRDLRAAGIGVGDTSTEEYEDGKIMDYRQEPTCPHGESRSEPRRVRRGGPRAGPAEG